jgi:hypothetical protein
MNQEDPLPSHDRIRRAQSCAADPRQAVREFYAAVAQPDMALVLFFCSTAYDLAVLAEEMERLFAGVQVVGCTTAGEIGPAGYRDHSLAGMSFPAGPFSAVSGLLSPLQPFEPGQGQALVQELLQRLESQAPQADQGNTFAFLMIDGLSIREETVTRTLQQALGRLPLVGGSAGDGLDFGRTQLYFQGRFRSDCAILTLVSTPLPFRVFMTQHFVAEGRRFVVTEAVSAQRLVREIDGRPAAQAYAEMLGVAVQDLDPMCFATWPLVTVIAGNSYPRSISMAHADSSLSFLCAIEEGMLLQVARRTDLVAGLEQTFAAIAAAIGEPQVVIGCDCILRRLEILQGGLLERVDATFQRHRVVGFCTYGEQFRGVHINQTLTGIAIGASAMEAE